MIRNHHKTTRPQAVKYTPDSFILSSASMLPFKEQWSTLPVGNVLMIVPVGETPLKQMLRRLVPQLRAQGRHVTAYQMDSSSGPLSSPMIDCCDSEIANPLTGL